MRLHSNPRPALGPRQFFGKFRQPSFSPLRPADQGFAENDFPSAQRIPHIAIGGSESLRGVAYRAPGDYGGQQFEQRIAHFRAALFPWLERVSKMQPEFALW